MRISFAFPSLTSWLFYLPTVDPGQNTAFPIFATEDLIKPHYCTEHNPSTIQPELTGVFCRPQVTLTVSLLHPWNSFNFSSIEFRVKHLISWGPVLQGPEKEDPHCKLHFPTKLITVVFGTSFIPINVPEIMTAGSQLLSCHPEQSFGRHLLPGWFLPLTISITSLAKLHKAILIFPAALRHQE